MLNDLLFELGTEELPSGAVQPLSDALAHNLVAAFAKANLQHGQVTCFATPRRLAVLIHDVQAAQTSQPISRRGPAGAAAVDAEGQPSPALLGFAKSCGVTIDKLTKTKTDKGEWWVYESTQAGVSTRELLPSLIKNAVAGLSIAKPMRWGSGDTEFVRPVHWSVLLLGDDVVSCEILGVQTGRQSIGHRFHHPQSLSILSPRSYESVLNNAFVIADFALRRQMIITQVQQLASSLHAEAIMPDALLDEVTSIVEWPHALMIDFSPKFLDVPAEALIAAMQSHQKCFALRDNKGQLLPHFITIANIESKNPAQVILGNENVMRARLSDADFFYRQDRKKSLDQFIDATKNVVFQARLGSLADKALRIQALMDCLVSPLELDQQQARRAAQLSKCDLMTGMVGEFPELQGLMGYYYACHDGETNAVAQALNEQYMPRFAADVLPCSNLGIALSLADRMDTLVGTFAIGQKPTGVKDPFKSRRHALAVVRMLIATPIALSLSTLINQARHIYGDCLQDADNAVAELRPFILDRLQSFYQGQGIASDIVNAVRARQDDWLFDLDKRVKAVLTFIKLPEAEALSAACKRVNNLLQHAPSVVENKTIDADLLDVAAEKVLFERVQAVELQVSSLYSAGDYGHILSQLAGLRDPVDAFFEHVMVMVEDEAIRQNRLRLLARLQHLLQGVADISLLQSGASS